MGDVTAFRRRGTGAPAAGGGTHGSAEPAAGEPMTIATLIARAFGVLDQPDAVHTPVPSLTHTGAPVRHLHVVRDTAR